MKLTFKRAKQDLHQLATLVAENAEAIEPGPPDRRVESQSRACERRARRVDSAQRPVLITLGLTADDAVLLRALEAYACVSSIPRRFRRLYPRRPTEWPPRRLVARGCWSRSEEMRLLRFSAVDFFEFRYVEAHGRRAST